MLPNLRVLVTATLSTFILAAAAGLFASVRLMQEPLTARTDQRGTADDIPFNRIALNWPLPEPGRTAALCELTMLAPAPIDAHEGQPETSAPADAQEPLEQGSADPDPDEAAAPDAQAAESDKMPSPEPAPDKRIDAVASAPSVMVEIPPASEPIAAEVTGTVHAPTQPPEQPSHIARLPDNAASQAEPNEPARPAAEKKRAKPQRTPAAAPAANATAALQDASAANGSEPFLFFILPSTPR
jgi:hypothetical protein